MKVRHWFVSNSSSSSFICDVCGEEASGWDISLSEANMYGCKNGHTFCTEHIINEDKPCVVYDNEYENFSEYSDSEDYEDGYEIPEIYCPVCQMKEIIDSDILLYLIKKTSGSKDNVITEIKNSFKDYDSFKKHITSKKKK